MVPYVSILYDWALATSSRKNYKTGVNHMKKFLEAYPRIPKMPFRNTPPNCGILTLCFFAAFLLLKKSIKSASTIGCYVAHVKNHWIKAGCRPEVLVSHVLTRVLKGIKRVRPRKRDTRPAFCYLLTGYPYTSGTPLPTNVDLNSPRPFPGFSVCYGCTSFRNYTFSL